MVKQNNHIAWLSSSAKSGFLTPDFNLSQPQSVSRNLLNTSEVIMPHYTACRYIYGLYITNVIIVFVTRYYKYQ